MVSEQIWFRREEGNVMLILDYLQAGLQEE
jgi:hypothetical protein